MKRIRLSEEPIIAIPPQLNPPDRACASHECGSVGPCDRSLPTERRWKPRGNVYRFRSAFVEAEAGAPYPPSWRWISSQSDR
jgi:hypothetical protein